MANIMYYSRIIFTGDIMKRFTVLMLLSISLITGCNTVAGFGQDLKRLGDSMHRAGEKHGN
jgi:predicted small secreted protein